MTNHTAAERIEVGDFIDVPAWKATGCVVQTRAAMMGTEDAQEVLLQVYPDQTTGLRWYRLEPTEYEVL